MLKGSFENIVDVHFTAEMENSLDTVELGEKDWVELLKEFYPVFHERITQAMKTVEKVKMEEKLLEEKCPECKGPLVEKEGRFGKFIACKNYPECKYTKNIEEEAKGKCPLCGSGLYAKATKKARSSKFFVCDKKGTDPNCPFISWDLPLENKFCDVCKSYMVLKRFKGKAYPRCGNKDCTTNQRKVKKEEETT
jgi:DNA topoisomerase-1